MKILKRGSLDHSTSRLQQEQQRRQGLLDSRPARGHTSTSPAASDGRIIMGPFHGGQKQMGEREVLYIPADGDNTRGGGDGGKRWGILGKKRGGEIGRYKNKWV